MTIVKSLLFGSHTGLVKCSNPTLTNSWEAEEHSGVHAGGLVTTALTPGGLRGLGEVYSSSSGRMCSRILWFALWQIGRAHV